MPRVTRKATRCALFVPAAAAALIALAASTAFSGASYSSPAPSGASRLALRAEPASIFDQFKNPVKTVTGSLQDFYKSYSQPPLLPMYRPFIVDFLTQTHLAVFDSRFKYDAVFALGLWEYYSGLMGAYDKLLNSKESEKIWASFASAVELDPAKVQADAEAITAYAKSASPADLLKHIEGSVKAPEAKAAQAFESIGSSLYTTSFSVGLFKIMQLSGIEVSRANVEEWAKALKVSASKVGGDLETWKANQLKLQRGEEMLREIEIREKKKLAERLEEKAKKLSEKAAAKSKEA